MRGLQVATQLEIALGLPASEWVRYICFGYQACFAAKKYHGSNFGLSSGCWKKVTNETNHFDEL